MLFLTAQMITPLFFWNRIRALNLYPSCILVLCRFSSVPSLSLNTCDTLTLKLIYFESKRLLVIFANNNICLTGCSARRIKAEIICEQFNGKGQVRVEKSIKLVKTVRLLKISCLATKKPLF